MCTHKFHRRRCCAVMVLILLLCSDGTDPDAKVLYADGLAPHSNLSQLSSAASPASNQFAENNLSILDNMTAGKLLGANELASSVEIPDAIPSDEIQMDTNGDGIVDENESQNQPPITYNAAPNEEIQMDTNGDGIVDENESQNMLGPNMAAQGSGGPGTQTQSCEGQLAAEIPLARKTLEVADQNARDFIRLLQAGGGIKQFPSTNLYWFAKLYSGTTYLEIRDLKNVEHPAMVAHFIPIFFGLYKDALDNYQNRVTSKVPAHWMSHFKASQDAKVSMTGAQISIETGAEAHIQGDIAKAFVLAYKTFVSKYCPDNPPPLEYFRNSFFSPAALKIFSESQADMFTEIARTVGPQGVSIEKAQKMLEMGSRIFPALDLNTVYEWREDAWDNAKKELGQ